MTESDYDDYMAARAANACENCGESFDELHTVHEAAKPYRACDECYAEFYKALEAGALIERKPAARETAPAIGVEWVLQQLSGTFGGVR